MFHQSGGSEALLVHYEPQSGIGRLAIYWPLSRVQ